MQIIISNSDQMFNLPLSVVSFLYDTARNDSTRADLASAMYIEALPINFTEEYREVAFNRDLFTSEMTLRLQSEPKVKISGFMLKMALVEMQLTMFDGDQPLLTHLLEDLVWGELEKLFVKLRVTHLASWLSIVQRAISMRRVESYDKLKDLVLLLYQQLMVSFKPEVLVSRSDVVMLQSAYTEGRIFNEFEVMKHEERVIEDMIHALEPATLGALTREEIEAGVQYDVIMSTTILPVDGTYIRREIPMTNALMNMNGKQHYVGHPATKQLLEDQGAIYIPGKLERLTVGQKALCVPLASSPRETGQRGNVFDIEISDFTALKAILIERIS